jgi:hypothetical protein
MISINFNKSDGLDSLSFAFPDIHPKARLYISFQRTLRVPDDGESYPLPAGLGKLPLRHIEDYGDKFSAKDLRRGGVIMPMYQSEATWLNFFGEYPMAIKVATGKVNAVTGGGWTDKLNADPQDYMVTPDQDWLDGFCIEKGIVRQFVAEPLGVGKTVEEVVTEDAEWGGIQLMVFPMKASEYIKRFEVVRHKAIQEPVNLDEPLFMKSLDFVDSASMGIAAGGLIEQEIYEDQFGIDVWDTSSAVRCFVHLANSQQYHDITGEPTPHKPITKNEYLAAGIPWFENYKEVNALAGGNFDILSKKRNVSEGDF